VPAFLRETGAPVINEAGHFTQRLFPHEADRVREPPVAAADDELVPVELVSSTGSRRRALP
jgi:hypothetical protein